MNARTKKFFSYYRPYLGLFISTMLFALVVAAIALVFPLLIRHITKMVLAGGQPDILSQIYPYAALMLALVAVQTVCSYYVDYRGHVMGAMMESDLREELFDHYQKLSFGFYDDQRTGQLMSRITNDLLLLAELYHHGPEDFVIYLIRFAGALIILAGINLPLTLVIVLFLPFMIIYAWFFSKRMRQFMKRNRERIGDINAQVEDTLSGIRVVKSFANEEIEQKKFTVENRRFLESRKSTYQSEAYLFEGIVTFSQLILVAVVVVGGASMIHASLDLADLLLFLLYIGYLIEPIQKFSHIVSQWQDGFTGFERFMEIMEIEPEVQDAPGALDVKDVQGHVVYQNVGFRYREDHTDVLRNTNLEVRAGETIALVGSSGVGKTTLCSLLPRFYEVSEGKIYLDGIDIQKITLRSLRRNIGVVQQDVYLFAGTVFENIQYGRPGASREEVMAASRQANAHDFIQLLPDGYDTDIGQRGVKLSGGQKQRLSIARVFLKNPPILIFDEATSALDNESERVIQESLEILAKNRTTFVIAHRLSTIRNAGRIVVLSERGIGEQGSHAELMALDGTYARLYALQFGNSIADGTELTA